jgi:hypothetical protein
MSHVRKDTLVRTFQWAKHLRPFWKKLQSKVERIAAKEDIKKRLIEKSEIKDNL